MAALHHNNMVAITDNEASYKYEGLAGIKGADNRHEVGGYDICIHWAPTNRADSTPRTPKPKRPTPGAQGGTTVHDRRVIMACELRRCCSYRR